MTRSTIKDVALRSGLSVATVDRVINARSPVRDETARRVLDAAEAVGFHASRLIRGQIERARTTWRLGVLLQRKDVPFYRQFAEALARIAAQHAGYGPRVVVQHLDDLSPQAVARQIEKLGAQVDAISLVASDHPIVNRAVETLHGKGVLVFALLSDISSTARTGYIGLDNRKAGRTAAWAVSTICRLPGKVGCFVGSHRYIGQEAREMGFRSYFREHDAAFTVLEPLSSLEDRQMAYEGTLSLLKRNPDLVALYVAGGGIEGVIAALRESEAAGRVVAVCHDLTEIVRAALYDGIVRFVISHPLDRVAEATVIAMTQALDGNRDRAAGEVLVPFAIDIVETV